MTSDKKDLDMDWERKKLILHYAAETRKFEIQLFWQRSLYFWGLVAASLVAFATLHKNNETDPHTLCVITICFGFLTSFAWALQSLGGKYWHEAWEQKLYRAEEAVFKNDGELFDHNDHHLFGGKDEKIKSNSKCFNAKRYSVSRIAIAMSYLSVLLWFSLAIFESNINFKSLCECMGGADCTIIALYFVTAILVLVLLYCGKSSESKETGEE